MSDETPGQVFEALLKEWEELLISEGYLEELEKRVTWRERFDRAEARFIEALRSGELT